MQTIKAIKNMYNMDITTQLMISMVTPKTFMVTMEMHISTMMIRIIICHSMETVSCHFRSVCQTAFCIPLTISRYGNSRYGPLQQMHVVYH